MNEIKPELLKIRFSVSGELNKVIPLMDFSDYQHSDAAIKMNGFCISSLETLVEFSHRRLAAKLEHSVLEKNDVICRNQSRRETQIGVFGKS